MANPNSCIDSASEPLGTTSDDALNCNSFALDSLINGTETVTSRTGKKLRSLSQLEQGYVISSINGGVWAAGQTFTALNQWMAFGGVAYKPKLDTALPYVVGADPTIDANVEPFTDLTTIAADSRYERSFDDASSAALVSDLVAGQVIKIIDRNNFYDVVTGETPDGFRIIDLANSSAQGKLIINGFIDFNGFGASGVDASAAMNSALLFSSDNSIPIIQKGGSFTCTSDLNVPLNAVMIGLGLPSISFTDSVIEIKGKNTEVNGFDLSCAGTVGNKGIVYSNAIDVSGTKILNNKFTTAIAINGVKLIVDGALTVSEDIEILNNHFEDIGRMGIELQNHGDTTLRFRDITINNNSFINTGTASNFGMGISSSGVGERLTVKNNQFDNNDFAAIENVGFFDSEWAGNTFKNQPDALFSFSGFTAMTNNDISNNFADKTNISARVFLVPFDDSVFANNNIHTSTVTIAGSNNSVEGNVIKSEASNVIVYDGTVNATEGNITKNNVLDNSLSSNNFSVLRYFEANCTNNSDYLNVILKGTGGSHRDEAGGATGNSLEVFYKENGVLVNDSIDPFKIQDRGAGFTGLSTYDKNNNTFKIFYQSGSVDFSLRIPDTESRQPTVAMSFKWSGRNSNSPRGGIIMASFGTSNIIDSDPALTELGVGTATTITRTNTGGFITWKFNLDVTLSSSFSGVMEFTINSITGDGNMEIS